MTTIRRPKEAGVDIPFENVCFHPLAHVLFPANVGPFVLSGATQYDGFGHDISAAYSDVTPDRRCKLTAYVYPGFATGRDAFLGVLAQVRAAHPAARVLHESRVEVADREGWFGEMSLQTIYEEGGVPAPSRSCVWLFEEGGWHVKYRVSMPEASDIEAICTDTRALIAAVGWPCTHTRLSLGFAADDDATQQAIGRLLPWLDALEASEESRALRRTIEESDLARITSLLDEWRGPLPPGLRSLVALGCLGQHGFLEAWHTAQRAGAEDDQECEDILHVCASYVDSHVGFSGDWGTSAARPVRVEAGASTLHAHAVHKYLKWIFGERGIDWLLVQVLLVCTTDGPRELAHIRLRDGRVIGVWFTSDMPAPLDHSVTEDRVVAYFASGNSVHGREPALDENGNLDLTHVLFIEPALQEAAPEAYEWLSNRLHDHLKQSLILAPAELH